MFLGYYKVKYENEYRFWRLGLKTGMENNVFWSEIDIGAIWRAGQHGRAPPETLRSTPPSEVTK